MNFIILVLAITTVESSWKVEAKSNKGAVGLMQLTPIAIKDIKDKAEDPKCKGVAWKDVVSQPAVNMKAGVCYLRLLKTYATNASLDPKDIDRFMIAAYNAGPKSAMCWIKDQCTLPKETQLYVPKVESAMKELGYVLD